MNLLCIKCSKFRENIGIKIKQEIGEEIFININLAVLSKKFVSINKEEILILKIWYYIWKSHHGIVCNVEKK